MYNIKKKNRILYKIYNRIKESKKIFILSTSWGADSNLSYFSIKKIIKKKLLNILNINHNLNVIEKKIKNIFKNFKIFSSKFKNKKFKKIEKFLKKKRFKKIKNLCNKKEANVWIFQNENDILENFIIQLIIKKRIINKRQEKGKKNILKKIKPLKKNNKKQIKKILIKKKIKWEEEKDNIKYKNLRNKIRINLLNNLKNNLNNFKKKIIKIINK